MKSSSGIRWSGRTPPSSAPCERRKLSTDSRSACKWCVSARRFLRSAGGCGIERFLPLSSATRSTSGLARGWSRGAGKPCSPPLSLTMAADMYAIIICADRAVSAATAESDSSASIAGSSAAFANGSTSSSAPPRCAPPLSSFFFDGVLASDAARAVSSSSTSVGGLPSSAEMVIWPALRERYGWSVSRLLSAVAVTLIGKRFPSMSSSSILAVKDMGFLAAKVTKSSSFLRE
mmetsp:Transcript_1185/g.2419  ORF Transcript_1185/g.2419 Transcript_1185/m.2419 type:complete len:233 (-) Transcript_1185:621-1319(-)